jgi:hypothetical protein
MKLKHEMIVVGFGRALGTRNTVDSVLKIPGQRHSVILLPDELVEIHAHLNAAKNNSILLVHNHPDHISQPCGDLRCRIAPRSIAIEQDDDLAETRD